MYSRHPLCGALSLRLLLALLQTWSSKSCDGGWRTTSPAARCSVFFQWRPLPLSTTQDETAGTASANSKSAGNESGQTALAATAQATTSFNLLF